MITAPPVRDWRNEPRDTSPVFYCSQSHVLDLVYNYASGIFIVMVLNIMLMGANVIMFAFSNINISEYKVYCLLMSIYCFGAYILKLCTLCFTNHLLFETKEQYDNHYHFRLMVYLSLIYIIVISRSVLLYQGACFWWGNPDSTYIIIKVDVIMLTVETGILLLPLIAYTIIYIIVSFVQYVTSSVQYVTNLIIEHTTIPQRHAPQDILVP